MRFDGFYGNDPAKGILSAAFDSGKIPHAFLIEGPAGCGKQTLAKILAQASVCTPSFPGAARPCGVCGPCVKALGSNHPDILLYSSGPGPRSFSVDTVRKIRADAFIKPNEAARKVYILLNIQNMTEQAQNAILKILEEPPASVLFLLTCDDKSRILETVRSRCTVITLGTVGQEDAVRAVTGQMPGVSPQAAAEAVEMTGHNIGRAKQMLSAGGTEKALAEFIDFAPALCGTSRYGFLRISGRFEKDSVKLSSFLDILPLLFRDSLAVKLKSDTRLTGCTEAAETLGSKCTLRQLSSLTEIALSARDAADRYANTTLLLTWLFSRLWQTVHA